MVKKILGIVYGLIIGGSALASDTSDKTNRLILDQNSYQEMYNEHEQSDPEFSFGDPYLIKQQPLKTIGGRDQSSDDEDSDEEDSDDEDSDEDSESFDW
ncbi:MAG: hypothetical protein LBJ13_00310 [Puniceicoccales bacterium]|jgi:hypothetical protein|nr:hypothetical protein [Puniceicoccales bacterium]